MKIQRDFVILLVGRILQAALALAAIRILTSLLDKENVGKTYLVTSLTFYFSLIFINPIGMYLNRKIHHWFHERMLFKAFGVLNWYFLGIAILSVPSVLFSYFVLNIGHGFLVWQVCALVFFNIYVGTWFQTLCPSLNMLEHRSAFVLLNLVAQALGLAASVAGVIFFNKDAFLWLLGVLIGQSVGAVLSWIYFRQKVESRSVSMSSIKAHSLFFNRTVLAFCLPIAFTTAFMWAQYQSYRLIIEAEVGAEFLGVLGVGLGVAASIAGLVESLVTQYFYPRYYASLSVNTAEVRVRSWNKLCLNALSVYLPATFYVVFGAPFILRILVNAQYSDSLTFVIWGAFIEFFRITTNLVYAVSQSEMRTKSTIVPYLLGAVIVVGGLACVLYFAHPLEKYYVPLVLALAGGTTCFSMYLSMRKVLPIQVDKGFIAEALLYAMPLILMSALKDSVQSLLGAVAICGVFGIYLLWVIWRLHERIESSRNALYNKH